MSDDAVVLALDEAADYKFVVDILWQHFVGRGLKPPPPRDQDILGQHLTLAELRGYLGEDVLRVSEAGPSYPVMGDIEDGESKTKQRARGLLKIKAIIKPPPAPAVGTLRRRYEAPIPGFDRINRLPPEDSE